MAANEFRSPIACSECHVVPTTAIHTLNHSLDLPFGPLSRSQGAVPLWDASTLTCSANYCHGNFNYGGVQGKAASLSWMGSLTGCTTCHDMPPAGHILPVEHAAPSSCSGCHGGTVNGDGTINVAGGLHINGQKDVVRGRLRLLPLVPQQPDPAAHRRTPRPLRPHRHPGIDRLRRPRHARAQVPDRHSDDGTRRRTPSAAATATPSTSASTRWAAAPPSRRSPLRGRRAGR